MAINDSDSVCIATVASCPYDSRMVQNDASPERTDSPPTPLSVLCELVNCTELNMDDMEPYTRAVLARARAVIEDSRQIGG